jgi:hypothetical protein
MHVDQFSAAFLITFGAFGSSSKSMSLLHGCENIVFFSLFSITYVLLGGMCRVPKAPHLFFLTCFVTELL